jgi:hypothetical protein
MNNGVNSANYQISDTGLTENRSLYDNVNIQRKLTSSAEGGIERLFMMAHFVTPRENNRSLRESSDHSSPTQE